jgi:hypothetical protein
MRTVSRAPNPIVLLDDSIALLRSVPASAWAGWAAGSLPFGLGVIAFTTEMTSSASAAEMLPAHSLVLAFLFLWMVCRQSIFSQRLRSILMAEAAPARVSLLAVARSQLLLWSTALILIPLGALSVAALPWTVAFYYSAAASPDSSAREVMRYGAAQASTWAFASVLELGVATLLWFVALLNAAVLLIGGPILMRTLTGQETIFTRDPQGMFNGTLLISALTMACLALDPILRAMYAIRSFRVDAIRTGVDLRAALSRCATVAVIALFAMALPSHAAAPQSIDPPVLDRTIRQVIRRPEYVWREPRRPTISSSSNVFLAFTEDTGRFIAKQIERGIEWIGEVVRTLERWLNGNPDQAQPAVGRNGANAPLEQAILYLLIALVAGAGVALLLRMRFTARKKAAVEAAAAPVAMDLNREDVSPDEAREDEWMLMAARFLEAGDLRLATRALYLAVLASLGQSGLISIHRARSNMDYRRELSRKARGNAALQQEFSGIVSVFEQTWYGRHPISPDAFDRFRSDAVALRTHAQA